MTTQTKIPFYRSAGFKISTCIIGAVAFLAIALDLVFDDGLNRITSRLVATQVDAEVEFVGTLLGAQVAFDQQASAEDTLARLVENSGGAISRVAILDAEGKPFAASGRRDLQGLYDLVSTGVTSASDAEGIAIAELTLPNGTKAGTVVVGWTTEHIAELHASIQRRVILATMVVGIIATAIVLIAFRFIVSRPMSRLASAVERLRRREYDFEVSDVERRDEFGLLSRSVESFRSDLSAAAELEARARETNAAFDATSAPLMVANAQGQITAINPAAQELMKKYREGIMRMIPDFDPTRILGQPLQRFHPDDHGRILDRIGASAVSTRLKFGEGRMKLQIQPIHAPDGSQAGYVLEWQDVTDEFRDRSRIEAIERTQLCAEFAADGNLKTCNDAFRTAVGAGTAKLADLIRSIEPKGSTGQEIVDQVLRGENVDGLLQIASGSGKPVFVECNINAMRDIDDTIHRLFFVARDVSEAQIDLEQARIEREQSERERTAVVDALRDGMSKLSGGDLSAEIEVRFAERFEELRRDYNATVQMLQSAMTEIAERAGKIRNETKDISTNAEILSQRSESTAATLEQTAAALDQLTGGMKNAAESAREASSIVADARASAEQSGEVVVRTVKAMDEIAASSKKVASIIKVIDDIAFQTNLLALNAGVEAARAGDAGRGFAVVASEVRALAQRSSDAAREINTLIGQSSAQVKSGVALVGETGEALQRIVGWVTNISERVVQIADAAKDQSSSLEDINGAVTQLDGATQQNAARLEETTAASEALRNDASTLVEAIARFRVPAAKEMQAPIKPTPPPRAPEIAVAKGRASASAAAMAAETWTDF